MQIKFGQLVYRSSIPSEVQAEMEKVSKPMAPVWDQLDQQGVDITVSREGDMYRFGADSKGYYEAISLIVSENERNDLTIFSKVAAYGMMVAERKAARIAARKADEQVRRAHASAWAASRSHSGF